MTKEQKILLLFVLAIAASSATFYVVKEKSTQSDTQANVVSVDTEMPSVQASTTQNQPTNNPVTQDASQNKTYKENATYKVPNGHSNEINITIALDSANIITDVIFSYPKPDNHDSVEYLGLFDDSFNSKLLIGKKIDQAQLSRVGGASLTTAAFNKVLTSIATKATS